MCRRVLLAAALLAAALSSACGGGGGTPNEGAVEGSLGDVLSRPGDDIALVPGTSDYSPGDVRVVFLVIDSRGKSIERPRARVWVAPSLDDRPFLRTTARLENVGVPGVSEAAAGDVTHVYVAHLQLPQAGKYVLVAEPIGGRPIQGALDVEVAEEPQGAGRRREGIPFTHADDRLDGRRPRGAHHAHAARCRSSARLGE